MRQGECSVCEGWIQMSEVMIQINSKQYCEVCYQETQEQTEDK